MVPPQGDEAWGGAGRVEVDSARRVAGEAFFRKGHMALDCRRTASMVVGLSLGGDHGVWPLLVCMNKKEEVVG